MNWTLEISALIAGVLTVLSPCILPILPPLLSASAATSLRHRPFWIVSGLAVSFTLFGSIFALFGSFLGLSNDLLREIALVILFFFGLSLLWPAVWETIGTRISLLGQKLPWVGRVDGKQGRWNAVLIGASLGLVWAPCAGPILGIIVTLAAVQKSFAHTLLLMGGYALGAAIPMLLIGYGGQRVIRPIQGLRVWGTVSQKVFGVLTLASVAGLYFHLDTVLLSRLPGQLFPGGQLEEKIFGQRDDFLVSKEKSEGPALPARAWGAGASEDLPKGDRTGPRMQSSAEEKEMLPVRGTMPEFSGISRWINSAPLTSRDLRGKVVLVDFWTYSCINCIRTLPHVTQWYEKYKDQGFVVVGVHTPEFAFEKDDANVKQAILRHGILYPVALDNDYKTWNAYNNHYWPAHYLIDVQGRIREIHFGEGNYKETERAIQTLLNEARLLRQRVDLESGDSAVDFSAIHSYETYIGYERAENFSSVQGMKPDAVVNYTAPSKLRLNEWALTGLWEVTAESARLRSAPGGIRFRFDAPKLNLVMAGKGVKGRVLLDGKPIPPDLRGSDVDRDGTVIVSGSRLYNLVSVPRNVAKNRLFEFIFEDPGATLYAFTFG